MIRGRLEKRSSKSNKHRSKSISQSQSKFKCFHSHKKDCPERRGKDSKKSQEPRDVDIAQAGYETVNVLVVSNSKIEKDWVMDSSCTFPMCKYNSRIFHLKFVDHIFSGFSDIFKNL